MAPENIENTLSSYLNETVRNASLNKAATQNQKAQELANQQYSGGDIGLLDVLVSERNVLDAKSNLAASDIQLRKAIVNIYTAAGGVWDIAENKYLSNANTTDCAYARGTTELSNTHTLSSQKEQQL